MAQEVKAAVSFKNQLELLDKNAILVLYTKENGFARLNNTYGQVNSVMPWLIMLTRTLYC